MPYPVAPSTVATNHLEVSVLIILAALLSRQPVPQKPLTSLLGFVRVTEFAKPVPHGSYHAQAVHDPPTDKGDVSRRPIVGRTAFLQPWDRNGGQLRVLPTRCVLQRYNRDQKDPGTALRLST